MINKLKIGFVTSLIVIVVLAVDFIYILNYKNEEIFILNVKILNLSSEIQAKNQQIKNLEDNYVFAKIVCISNTNCKERYSENLRSRVLELNNLINLASSKEYTHKNSGINLYEQLQGGDESFANYIKENCPRDSYTYPGKLVSWYYYGTLDDNIDKQIVIVMDDENVEVLCTWIFYESTNSYIKPILITNYR